MTLIVNNPDGFASDPSIESAVRMLMAKLTGVSKDQIDIYLTTHSQRADAEKLLRHAEAPIRKLPSEVTPIRKLPSEVTGTVQLVYNIHIPASMIDTTQSETLDEATMKVTQLLQAKLEISVMTHLLNKEVGQEAYDKGYSLAVQKMSVPATKIDGGPIIAGGYLPLLGVVSSCFIIVGIAAFVGIRRSSADTQATTDTFSLLPSHRNEDVNSPKGETPAQ